MLIRFFFVFSNRSQEQPDHSRIAGPLQRAEWHREAVAVPFGQHTMYVDAGLVCRVCLFSFRLSMRGSLPSVEALTKSANLTQLVHIEISVLYIFS